MSARSVRTNFPAQQMKGEPISGSVSCTVLIGGKHDENDPALGSDASDPDLFHRGCVSANVQEFRRDCPASHDKRRMYEPGRNLHSGKGREQRSFDSRRKLVLHLAGDCSVSGSAWNPAARLDAVLCRVGRGHHVQDGTFTTSNAGVYDTTAGAFSQLDRITSGTGKFTESKDRLIFITATGSGDAGFKSYVRGELCLTAQ